MLGPWESKVNAVILRISSQFSPFSAARDTEQTVYARRIGKMPIILQGFQWNWSAITFLLLYQKRVCLFVPVYFIYIYTLFLNDMKSFGISSRLKCNYIFLVKRYNSSLLIHSSIRKPLQRSLFFVETKSKCDFCFMILCQIAKFFICNYKG